MARLKAFVPSETPSIQQGRIRDPNGFLRRLFFGLQFYFSPPTLAIAQQLNESSGFNSCAETRI